MERGARAVSALQGDADVAGTLGWLRESSPSAPGAVAAEDAASSPGCHVLPLKWSWGQQGTRARLALQVNEHTPSGGRGGKSVLSSPECWPPPPPPLPRRKELRTLFFSSGVGPGCQDAVLAPDKTGEGPQAVPWV